MSRASARAPHPRRLVAALLPLLSAPVVLAVLAPVARAGCDASAPVAGQTVTCTASAPNPQATPVLLGPGATGVTVNVLAGAQLATANANTLYIDPAAGAVINNQGSIAASGTVGSGTAAGINADALVTVNNAASGSITSAQGFALYLLGGSTVVNEGSISAPVGYGLAFKGAGDSTLLNRGSISRGSGGVQFGSGNDRMQMLAGTVSSVEQGEGDDRLQVSGGTITGLVQQGNGRDDFVMTGGTVGALQQGDGTDTFTLSGGRIIGAFEDGDRAWMTGGRIGRVNMKLEKNLFDMSGGTVDGNVVTGFDTDTVLISGTAYIGGNISVSGGDDSLTLTDGTVRGQVLMSTGNDTFNWRGGGIIYGAIDLGPDDDVATLANLNQSHLGALPSLTGGSGSDRLQLDNVKTTGVARFSAWESISLVRDSQLTFDGALVLGDAGTGTGALDIDASSALFASGSTGAIRAFDPAALVTVTHAGRIDLDSNGSAGDVFTIAGNYTGNNGALYLNTVLAGDGAASDRLVISGGSASGQTGIGVFNAGGGGAATVADGILLVQAINGARTSATAFALFSPVSAGAYEYFLFKGGVSAGTSDNWYLRSTFVNAQTPAPAPSGTTMAPPPPPEALGGTPPPLPPPPAPDVPDPSDLTTAEPPPPAPPAAPADVPPPVAAPVTQVPTTPSPLPTGLSSPPTPGARRPRAALVPIYRLETAAYAAVPPVLQGLQQASLGTFHERQGEQRLLVGQGAVQGGWIRMVGQSSEQHWKGDALAGFDGDLLGLQAGADVYASDGDGWHQQVGVLVGRTRATGTVTGLALAWENVQVGQLRLDDRHAGLYWTGVGNAGGYIDVVLLRSRFRGEAWSTRGLGINVRGDGTAASLEAGRPWPLGASGWSLEPQVQVLWQRQSLDDARDAFAALQFDSDTAWSGRIGLRLAADRGLADNGWQPYFKLDYWQAASGEHRVRFDGEPIRSEQRARAWQAGVGVVGRFNRTISAYAVADYTADIGGGRDARRRTLEATLGLRADW